MAMKLYNDVDIQDIANAIREKNGQSTTYKVSDMAAAIASIPEAVGNYNVISIDNGDGTQDIQITDAEGSSSVTAVPLSVTANGIYTAQTGEAYSPVTVNVPTVDVEPLSVTANGTYDAPSGKAYSPVTVNVPIPAPKLQAKSATPTESQQTITADSGYDGLSSVSVGAIPSNYIGSDVRVQTFYTGTATPTAAQGNDGDIYLKVVT